MHCSLQKSKFRTSYWYSEHDASCNTFLLCVIPQYRTERHLEFWTTGSHRRGRSLSPKIKAVCLHEGHFIKKANGICRMEITICQNEVKILCIKWPTYEVIIITVLKEFEVKYILSEDSFFKRDFIHLFLERGREGEREEKKHQCVVGLSGAPYWGPVLQPRHVPLLGIKPATLWFTGWCSIHWATPARAIWKLFINCSMLGKVMGKCPVPCSLVL